MNTKSILFCFLTVLTFQLSAQKIKFVNTKDLISIVDTSGLKYALTLVSPQSICYIDPIVANYLATKIDINKCTDKTELFLYEFCISNKSVLQQQIQNSYIENKIKIIEGYVPGNSGEFPAIRESEMYFLTVNPDKNRERLLINYYNTWLKKSERFKAAYINGDSGCNNLYSLNYSYVNPYRNHIHSYLCCNDNCYRILLALKKIGSKFATSQRMNAQIELRSKYSKYPIEIRRIPPHVTEIAERVNLSREYNSIAEINYQSEPELQRVLNFTTSPRNWINFIHNKNLGYIQFGSSEILGWNVGCEIALINKNILLFYGNKAWDENRYLK